MLLEPWDEAILYGGISKGWNLLGDEKKSAKFEASANSAAQAALASSRISSDVPYRPGSVVGNALL